MSKPTPRPWKLFDRGRVGPNGEPEIWIGIDHPEYGDLTHMTVRAGCDEAVEVGCMKANAAHIVKCVNMHEELVEQLRQAWACIEHIKERAPTYEREASILLLKDIQSLLVKAEGAE